jgi:excisionase family DNA binding protein
MRSTVDARPRFMKVRKATEYLGIGRTSLKDLIAAGAFPGASKIGSHHLIPVEDLDGYADRLIAAARANRECTAVSRRSERAHSTADSDQRVQGSNQSLIVKPISERRA